MRTFSKTRGRVIVFGIVFLLLLIALLYLPIQQQKSYEPIVIYPQELVDAQNRNSNPGISFSDRLRNIPEYFKHQFRHHDNPYEWYYLSLPVLLFLASIFFWRNRRKSPKLALACIFSLLMAIDLMPLMGFRIHVLLAIVALVQAVSFLLSDTMIRQLVRVIWFIILFSVVYAILYDTFEIPYFDINHVTYTLYLLFNYIFCPVKFISEKSLDESAPLFILFIVVGAYAPGFISQFIKTRKDAFKYTSNLVLPVLIIIWVYMIVILYPWLYVNTYQYLVDFYWYASGTHIHIWKITTVVPFRSLGSLFSPDSPGKFSSFISWDGCNYHMMDLSIKLQYLGVYLMIFLSTLINLANVYQATVPGVSIILRRRILGLSLGLLIIVLIHAIMVYAYGS